MFAHGGPSLRELIQQALSSTDRGYDLLAPKFDLTPFRTPDVVLEPAARVLADRGKVKRALDVACGTGAALAHLRPLCKKELWGVDRSEGMIRQARARTFTRGAGALVHLARADALQLPFRESFDLVTCFGAFGHILEKDEPAFVRSIRSVLAPGGRFVFYTADPPPLWSPGRWLAHGFNAAMRVRNALISPPFIMYYLTFLLPRARQLLEEHGFKVELGQPALPRRYERLKLVIATRG